MFKTVNNGKLPTRATKFSAGVDVYANEDITINAGETAIVPLGIKIDIISFIDKNKKIFEMNFWEADEYGDDGTHYSICSDKVDAFLKSHYIALKPRSSLRAKGLISHTAVIDLDYPDELKMIIHNPIKDVINKRLDISRTRTILCNSHEIKKGDKIGQLLLMEHKSYLFGI